MAQEAAITSNGTILSHSESMIVRLATDAFEEILAEGLNFRNDGIPITDQIMIAIARIRILLPERTPELTHTGV
jgi:hypothetical protein